jgi:hypothetical protein
MIRLLIIAGLIWYIVCNEAHAAVSGYLIDEETSGMYRICYYDTVYGIRPLTLRITRSARRR